MVKQTPKSSPLKGCRIESRKTTANKIHRHPVYRTTPPTHTVSHPTGCRGSHRRLRLLSRKPRPICGGPLHLLRLASPGPHGRTCLHFARSNTPRQTQLAPGSDHRRRSSNRRNPLPSVPSSHGALAAKLRPRKLLASLRGHRRTPASRSSRSHGRSPNQRTRRRRIRPRNSISHRTRHLPHAPPVGFSGNQLRHRLRTLPRLLDRLSSPLPLPTHRARRKVLSAARVPRRSHPRQPSPASSHRLRIRRIL
jgi:hypothetical protein